jgi:UDP-N-acetylglucosamine acyltransferase
VGLRRRGNSAEEISALKRAYRELFFSGMPMRDQVKRLTENATSPLVKEFLSFIEKSARGICRPAARGESEE